MLGPNVEPIPGYRLIERIGRGGFGEVWKAEAPGGLLKAIKFVVGNLESSDDSDLAEQELKSLTRVKTIRHPYILSLERFEVVDGQLVIVMELADRNLWDRFRECRSQGLPGIPKDELLSYMEEAAEALDLMNGLYNLQHLDIKPQNLFLVYNHIKVADFGLVKDFEGKRGTITGGVTPIYAAPETFDGWVSRNSDQYSLAIVYQELLTGQRPFNGTLARQLVLQHMQAPPDVAPLPESDRPAVQRALAKKPDDRFPTCAEFVATLYQTLAATPAVVTTSTPVDEDTSIVNKPPPSGGSGNGVHKVRSSATRARPKTELISRKALRPNTSSGNDSGVLSPTLVIGLGGVGNNVLRYFRREMSEKYEGQPIPCIRFLAIDTDSNALRTLANESGITLTPDELFLTGLGRPSRYLRSDHVANIESWLGSHALYQLPKKPQAAELRAFGRLALLDHVSALSKRIREEIEACQSLETLAESNRVTNLGIRGPTPRVYIVAGLAGGTGSGMFLDAAYLVRSILKQLGEQDPAVIGVLMLPPCDRFTASAPLANAHAALKELMHFSRDDSAFSAKHDPKQPAEFDPNPPFQAVIMLPLTVAGNVVGAQAALEQASSWLTTDALSPIGRVAERHRDAFAEVVDEAAMAQTAATFQFTWPREGAARVAGRQLGRELLSRWTEKDAVRNRPAVTQWVEARWQELGLVPETLADRFHQYVTEGLGRAAVEQVERLIAPLVNNGPANVDIDSLHGLLDRICLIMGPPDPSYTKVDVGRAANMFEKARSEFSKNYDKQVADLAIQGVELAGMRVAGSEEAMRQIGEKAKQALNSYESLAESLSNEVSESSRKLMQMIVNFDRQAPSGKRRDAVVIEMLQLFREYPKKQYQSMLAAELREIYRGIAGSIPEFMHEMNLCRNRPAETAKELERRIQEDGNLHATNSASRTLLPGGDESLTAFAKRIVLELTDAELLEADELAQAQIVDRFQGFLNFCLASGPKAEHLADVLERTGTDFFLKRLPNLHPADLLPSHKLDGEMKQALRHCIPPLASANADLESMITIVSGPASDSGREILAAVKGALNGATVDSCPNDTNVVFYRELRHLRLAELPHMGQVAREAYQKAMANGQVTPHSRLDVEWKPVK